MDFKTLEGRTLKSVERNGDESIDFVTVEGGHYRMWHSQDCCETVEIESIVGDVADLIGTPILLAEEATSADDPPGDIHEYPPESQTWTFYKLRTIKGSVDIRWHGSSNGYYGESVEFEKID